MHGAQPTACNSGGVSPVCRYAFHFQTSQVLKYDDQGELFVAPMHGQVCGSGERWQRLPDYVHPSDGAAGFRKRTTVRAWCHLP